MRLLYVSVHSALQYDEVSLLESLGYKVDVGAADGAAWKWDLDRPSVGSSVAWDESTLCCYDIIVVMHDIDALARIWSARREDQRIIWRTIGQSSPHHERFVTRNCAGVEIIRYSPKERNIECYAGESSLIRFYKDKNEFRGWTGGSKRVMVVRNNFLKRGFADDLIMQEALDGVSWNLFGVGNDRHPHSVGVAPYSKLIESMKRADVFFATHSVPASYTLNLIEALMTGTPVVAMKADAVGASSGDPVMNALARRTYELDSIIQNGVNGFLVGSAEEARLILLRLLADPDLRRKIGGAGRARAIELFDRSTIAPQWRRLLASPPRWDWRRSLGFWRVRNSFLYSPLCGVTLPLGTARYFR